MFGKYFRSQRNTKHVKNSYAKTAGLPACLLGIFMLWLTQHACSVTSQISWEHSKFHGLLTIFSSILFWSKQITIFARLSPLGQPWKKCRFIWIFTEFPLDSRKKREICPKLLKWDLKIMSVHRFCESDYFQRWFFEWVSIIYSIIHVKSELIFVFWDFMVDF